MKVRFSPRATEDIIAIADYLSERNPLAARSVDATVRRTVELLNEFPGK